MQSFKLFVESLDSSYPYEKGKSGENHEGAAYHSYHFKDHNGARTTVVLLHHPNGKSAELSFFDKHNSIEKSGKQGSKAVKIFSTVKKIVSDHAAEHPNLKHIEFTSSKIKTLRNRNRTHSRAKLYDRFAKSMGGHTEVGDIEDTHMIPVNQDK